MEILPFHVLQWIGLVGFQGGGGGLQNISLHVKFPKAVEWFVRFRLSGLITSDWSMSKTAWAVLDQNAQKAAEVLQNPKKYGHIIMATSISALSFVTHSSGTRLRQIVFHLDLASDKDYTLRISLPHCDFPGISVLLISTKFNPRSRSLLFGLGMLPWALCNLDWSSFD